MADNKRPTIVLIRPNGKAIANPNTSTGPTAVEPPYWLAAMGGYLKSRNINVLCLDAEAAGQKPVETAALLRKHKPMLIGILVFSNDITASTWQMPAARLLCRTLKKVNPDQPVFLWGNHPSALPERTLKEEGADYVIVGEGFDSVEMLYLFYEREYPVQDYIHGVQYLKEGRLCGDPRLSLIGDLNVIPPNGWDLIPAKQRLYRNNIPFALVDFPKRDQYGVIFTSLGSKGDCIYSATRTFSGGRKSIRYKSVNTALAEVDWWVKNRKIHYLRILDECFTTNRLFVMEFMKQLIRRNYNLSIWLNAGITDVDEELLRTMKEAGVKWIAYNIETFSDTIRKRVRSDKYTQGDIKTAIKLTQSLGICVSGSIMFGLPGENLDDMKADFEMLKVLNVDYPNIYCTMPYPGSLLYKETAQKAPSRLPKSWQCYAQLSYDTKPIPTNRCNAAEILRYRDQAFQDYFTDNEAYWSMFKKKLGQTAVDIMKKVVESSKIRRRLLEKQ